MEVRLNPWFSFPAGAEKVEDMTSVFLFLLPFAGAISFLSTCLMSPHSPLQLQRSQNNFLAPHRGLLPCPCSWDTLRTKRQILAISFDKWDLSPQAQEFRSVPCNIYQNLCESLFPKYWKNDGKLKYSQIRREDKIFYAAPTWSLHMNKSSLMIWLQTPALPGAPIHRGHFTLGPSVQNAQCEPHLASPTYTNSWVHDPPFSECFTITVGVKCYANSKGSICSLMPKDLSNHSHFWCREVQ